MTRRIRRLLLGLSVPCALLSSAPASAGEPDFYSCTVRIEHAAQQTDGSDSAPSIEEASDLALEAACALQCVATNEVEAAGQDPGADAVVPAGEVPAEEDPDGIEACIELCAEQAEVLGTHCTDAAAQTVYADGAFDAPESEPDGAPAPDEQNPSP